MNKELAKKMMGRTPIRCSACGGKMKYIGAGQYQCYNCENIELDDFGKVKAFLDENGPSPAVIVADCTGIPIDIVNEFLKEGRLEIPEGSSVYIKCESCGCAIRFGRFCPECLKSSTNSLKGVFFNPDVGERPRYNPGAMHHLGKDN